MLTLIYLVFAVLRLPFKSKSRLEAENAALRHQVLVLRRQVRGRVCLTNFDRLLLVRLYRWFPSILQAVTIIQPETLVRWHRAGFRYYWRWESCPRGGRPQINAELRALIRRMSMENPLWARRAFTASCSSDNPKNYSAEIQHPAEDHPILRRTPTG
jgi:hypothetical protein